MMLDRRLMREADIARAPLVAAVVCGTLGGALTASQALLLARIIDQAFLKGRGLHSLQGPLEWLIAAIIGRALLAYAGDVSASRGAIRVMASLRQRLFELILALGPLFASGEKTGELTNTVVEGVDALDAYYAQYLPQVALAVLVPLIILVLVTIYDPLSGVVLFVTGPLIPLFMYLIGKMADVQAQRQWQTLSVLSSRFLDALEGLTTLKLLGRSRDEAEKLAETGEEYRVATLGVMRVAFLSAFALEMIGTISTAVVAVEVGIRLLYGHMPFEHAFAVLVMAPEFYAPLRTLGARFHAGIAGAAASKRIFAILDTKPASTEPGTDAPVDSLEISGTIRFDNVTFAYSSEREPAVRDVSFEILTGGLVALVGPTGAGKSTVAALLMRFVSAQHGTVTVGGRPLSAIQEARWREHVAWVPQEPYLFHETVAENIRRGRPSASDEEVASAAGRANAAEFIGALPSGYETVIGERGARLSAGQAQRIALARALLRHAPLLILDEPTSHLDAQTEAALQNAIEDRGPDRTTVVIAHRLHTCVRADRIVVLDKGCVVEQGTHRELLAAGGLYARMVRATSHGDECEGVAPSVLRTERAASIPAQSDDTGAVPDDQCASPRKTHLSVNPVRLLTSLLLPHWRELAATAALSTLTVASNVALLATSAYLIARAALHPSVETLAVAIVGVRFFGIARGVFRYAERLVSHDATLRLVSRLRVRTFRSVEPCVPAIWSEERRADWLSRLVGDVDTLQHLAVRVVVPAAACTITMAAAVAVLSLVDARLGIVTAMGMLLAGVAVPWAGARCARGSAVAKMVARSALHTVIVDGIEGISDLLSLGAVDDQGKRMKFTGSALAHEQLLVARVGAAVASGATVIANLTMVIALALALPALGAGPPARVMLPVLALGVLASFEAAMSLASGWQHLGASMDAMARLTALEGRAPAVAAGTNPATQGASTELAVCGLGFRYPKSCVSTLSDVSFRLDRGKMIAVVGASGAGKSTLVSLVARLWECTEGSITIGGVGLRDLYPDAVRSMLAVVSQESHLFDASVRENLLLGRPGATQADVEDAARQAGIHAFVASLPRGYETMVGERGMRLSGGERRRLAIARALLRDAPIGILDEATANLDALAERDVMRAVREAFRDRALLVVTHRLAGIVEADEILVMDGGRVVERGNHASLLAVEGLYRTMWDLQTVGLA